MHDATMEMNATTGKMANTTEGMNKAMCEVFDSGRQGAALDLRDKQWERLENSKKLEDKGTYSGLYFLAFEFQLWSNLCLDAQSGERERLMQDAVDEFFRRLLGITHWTAAEIDPFAGKNPLKFGNVENEKASFNALAGSIERNNRKQESAVEGENEAVSMLTLVETGLRAGKQIREHRASRTDFPAYVDIILQREELAIRLLKARTQVMGLAVLGYLTPMTRNISEGIKFKYLGKKWDLDFNELNESQVQLASFRLGEAIAARDMLQELGIKVPVHPGIAKIFSHMTVKNMPGEAGAKVKDLESPAARAQANLITQIKDYSGWTEDR
jgi:hypothetical protein